MLTLDAVLSREEVQDAVEERQAKIENLFGQYEVAQLKRDDQLCDAILDGIEALDREIRALTAL